MSFLRRAFAGAAVGAVVFANSISSVLAEMPSGKNVVPASEMIDTGRIGIPSTIEYVERPLGVGWGYVQTIRHYDHMSIDWSAKDNKFVQALDCVYENACRRVDQSENLQTILKKPKWRLQDLCDWEKEVAAIVSEELNKIPGLDEYRTADRKQVGSKIKQAFNLNEMAVDIGKTDKSFAKQFCCQEMAIFEAIVSQKIYQKDVLSIFSDKSKAQFPGYFMAYVYVSWDGGEGGSGLHAIIITPSGNVVEATSDPDLNYTSAWLKASYLVRKDEGGFYRADVKQDNYLRRVTLFAGDRAVYIPSDLQVFDKKEHARAVYDYMKPAATIANLRQ